LERCFGHIEIGPFLIIRQTIRSTTRHLNATTLDPAVRRA
jgi:hypothetical protein